MDTVITAGDDFSYSTPSFLLTALAGQTVSYGAGSKNYQTVTNGFDEVTDITGIPVPPLSADAIEAIFDAIGIDDPELVGFTNEVISFEAERLLYDIFSDNSATEESIAALDEVFAINGLFASLPDLVDEKLNDDDSLDIVAIIGLANQIYQDLDTGFDLTVVIDSGDSFDFVVGKTTVTKLLGQTVSHVSGEDNEQTIVNGLEINSGSVSEPSASQIPGTSMAVDQSDQGENASQEGFSIIIDTGDDFVFQVGETNVVKMFGQTVSYVTGVDNQQTITNGPSVFEDSATGNTSGGLQDNILSGGSSTSADMEVETELPSILISTGDSFSFDVGDTTLTKMFGQTVSYASGEDLTQTVVDGSVIETGETAGTADPFSALEGTEALAEVPILPDAAISDTSGDSDGIIEILTLVADIVGKLEGQSDISIVIDTGDTFVFNVDDVEITKMFGQTVSYANGDNISQTVANGFETFQAKAVSEDLVETVLDSVNINDPDGAEILTAEFGSEAEQLLDEIFTDDSAIAEVIAALDEVFAQSSFGSVSGLISESQNDDDSTDVVAILELIRQISDDLGDDSELSIAIETGDDFQFNVGTTTVTKMFGQTVSYVTGSRNEQTVINGSEIEASAGGSLFPGESPAPYTAPAPPSEIQDDGNEAGGGTDDFDDGFSIVINAGENFIFDVGETDIVKMFGQTVSYASGVDITQSVANGFAVDNDESTNLSEAENDRSSQSAASVSEAPAESVIAPADSDQDDETPNILVEATSTYTFDVGDVEVVKMFGQTVSYVSGERLTQEIVNGFELDEIGSTSGVSSAWSATEPTVGSDFFGEAFSEDDSIDDTLELLTQVAEIVGDLEDPSDFSVAIGAGNDFSFDVGEADIVKLYGQTVSYLDGADDSQYVNNGPVIDPVCEWLDDIDSPNAGLTYRMYVAGLGRTPDEEGFRFWTSVLDDLDANRPWVDTADFLADRFIEAPEFQALYGLNPSNSDYVNALYWNVLGRSADAGGYDYWVGRLEAGSGVDDMLVAFAQSAEAIAHISPDCDHDAWLL